MLDVVVKVLEYWRRQQGVVTRRSRSTQIYITEMDLALCLVTSVQLARHAAMRRKLAAGAGASRSLATLLHEVSLVCLLDEVFCFRCPSVTALVCDDDV